MPDTPFEGGADRICCCGVGGKGDQGHPKIFPKTTLCVVTVSKMGKMEGEEVWEWASVPHMETCQGQVGVRVCS